MPRTPSPHLHPLGSLTRHPGVVAEVVVESCSIEGDDFAAVLRLLKGAKATVGFLPDAAVRDRAIRGTLLVAWCGGEVVGYLLYDLPRNDIRIGQLVVDRDRQGSGVARLLVEHVFRLHGNRRSAFLECRRDFAASRVWPKLGFIPVGERPGRSAAGKRLTIWRRDFGWPDLFTALAEADPRPIAALDANVVIDLADGSDSPAQRLKDDWVVGAVRLTTTDETFVEIDRHQDDAARVRHKHYAASLDRLATNDDWQRIEASLVAGLGSRAATYHGDIRHVAKAAAGGARWFVTRDEKFRRACRAVVTAQTDLDVVTPSALIVELDRLVRGDLYRPADLEGTDVVVREVRPDELDAVARLFVHQRGGERWSTFRDRVNDLLAEPETTRGFVFDLVGDLVAFAVVRAGAVVEVPVCRVRPTAAGSTIARHLLGWLRGVNADGLSTATWLTDADHGDIVGGVLEDEGFLPAPRGRTALAIRGAGTFGELRRYLTRAARRLEPEAVPVGLVDGVRDAEPTVRAAFAFEEVFAPFAVLGAGLPTFLVPIKPGWASDLFDPTLSRGQLFPRERALALQREHVYYRSPRSSGGLAAPARLLWYVSGTRPGGKTIRATSHLDEVVVGDADRVHARFAHLGVYSRDQVRTAADMQGRVMALRFSHTRLLDEPVTLERYADLLREDDRGVAVAGPQPVSEQVFAQIVRSQP